MTIPPRPERRRMANTGFRVFRECIGESSRLAGLAIRLTWRASPRLVFGLLPLVVLRAALPSLELLLSKAVVDRAARDLGLGGQASALPPRLPLAAWIALAAGVLAAGQLVQPFSSTFQSLLGDRLTGSITEGLIDRPLGSRHRGRSDLAYAVNYGYLPGTVSGDGAPVDAYLLDVDKPVCEASGIAIAVVPRGGSRPRSPSRSDPSRTG